jgi:hypothetical protein
MPGDSWDPDAERAPLTLGNCGIRAASPLVLTWTLGEHVPFQA